MKDQNRYLVNIGGAGGFPFVIAHDISSELKSAGGLVVEQVVQEHERLFSENDDVRFRMLMNHSMNSSVVKIRTRTLSWMQDNPFQIGVRGECDDPLQHFLCADADHVDEVAYWFGAVNPAIHLPHWASTISPINLDPEYIERSFFGRPYGLLFVGSISLALLDELRAKLRSLHPKLQQFASGVADLIRSGDPRSITSIGISVGQSIGLDPYSENKKIFRGILSYVDTYIRQENRVRLFRALEGMDMVVVSGDFADIKQLAGTGPKLFGGTGHMQKDDAFLLGLYVMCHSKLMINNLPNYRNGVTERFFNAQIRGCAVISETNTYLENEFEDGKDVYLYNPFDLKNLKEKILHILNDKEELRKVAMAGYQKTRRKHLAKNRLDMILSKY